MEGKGLRVKNKVTETNDGHEYRYINKAATISWKKDRQLPSQKTKKNQINNIVIKTTVYVYIYAASKHSLYVVPNRLY